MKLKHVKRVPELVKLFVGMDYFVNWTSFHCRYLKAIDTAELHHPLLTLWKNPLNKILIIIYRICKLLRSNGVNNE